MKTVAYDQYLPEFYQKMSHQGVFLTVKGTDGSVNTMTIGWGAVGWMWSRKVLTVMVRLSRHTHALLEGADCFTVSIPKDGALDQALAYCGTKSGRDGDKLAACQVTALPGRSVDCPVIGQAWLHYECKILSRSMMQQEQTDPGLLKRFYGDQDLHEFFYGEITAVYCLE